MENKGEIRDEEGRFIKGKYEGGPGRPRDTAEKKLVKKAIKELIKDYREKLAEVLPELSPILTTKALSGDIQAIKELHDRVMGKPEQKTDITSGGKPLPLLGGITKQDGSNNNGNSETIKP